MPVHNKEIAKILNEIADLLDIKGENQFRIRSYRNAARTISGLTENITQIKGGKKKIKSLPGIGESIAEKIEEIANTGRISQLDELKKEIPESLVDIMKLEQMGPQRTKILNEKLNIQSIKDLEKAAKEGEIEKLEGFGKKTSENILKEIEEYSEKGGSKRFKLHEAGEMIKPMVKYLKKNIKDITIAGSYRRKKETVGDIDILGISKDPDMAMDYFVNYEEVERILAKGESRSSVKLRTGLQVDMRIFNKESYGAALLYFTGSKAHSIALRKEGQEKSYKVNEYGIFKNKKRLAGKSEKEMYKKLGLLFIEPEIREDNGEIEAAKNNQLPELITPDQIRGDLQSHTNETDGKYSLEEMVKAAENKGYEYFAITDHSKKVSMANGLDEKRLAYQIDEIDKLNRKIKTLKILKSVEVDILEDGSLDLSDEILKELDLVVCAVHYNMNLSRSKQTKRILKAMENPYFNILAHPTGRMIGKRSGYDIDMDKIMKEARDKGCFLEINSNPDRLDLSDNYIRQAKETGLKLAVSTDAHSLDNLEYMKYGVAQARRGWLEKDDIINTRSWKELKELLKRN
ncbi:MAG: DNA polymerase/3'-5' exonuclease PolX [Bacteroidales bacterium]